MSDITPFSNGEFNIDMIPEGDTFKVTAPGLARALGFRDAPTMMRSVPDSEKWYTSMCTPGGEQQINFLTEPGFYRVIGQRQAARVKDPAIRAQVERFQNWFYGDVLPTIRRTGGYTAPAPALSDEELVHRALQVTHRRVQELEAREAENAPKVAYHDTFVADEDLIQFRTLANQIDVGEQELRRLLSEHGWIYNDRTQRWSNKAEGLVWESRWRCSADKKRYFRLIPNHKAPRLNGEVRQTLKIPPDGVVAVTRAVRRWLAGEEVQEQTDVEGVPVEDAAPGELPPAA